MPTIALRLHRVCYCCGFEQDFGPTMQFTVTRTLGMLEPQLGVLFLEMPTVCLPGEEHWLRWSRALLWTTGSV
jgi:hypothetical protein